MHNSKLFTKHYSVSIMEGEFERANQIASLDSKAIIAFAMVSLHGQTTKQRILKSSVVSDMTLCCVMKVNRRFEGTYRLFFTIKKRYIPKHKTRHSCENLKSNIVLNSNLLYPILQLLIILYFVIL
jgi:hypothetical protein